MTQDDYKITDADYITWCAMCSLASYMKDCKHCRFNIGLPFKAIKSRENQGDTILIQHLAEIKPAIMSMNKIKA